MTQLDLEAEETCSDALRICNRFTARDAEVKGTPDTLGVSFALPYGSPGNGLLIHEF